VSAERSAAAYGDFVRNRRIAVVGPARTLLDRRLGASIDDHDLIVRFNDAFDLFPIPPKLAEDIGARTDVLYCNQVVLRKILERDRADRERLLAHLHDIRYIACTNNSLSFTGDGEPTPQCGSEDAHVIDSVDAWLREGGARTRLRVVSAASAILARWLDGNWARTGLVGVFDLLTFDPASVFVCGMTFYHGGGHLLAAPSAEMHPLRNRDGSLAQSASGRGHDSYRELDIARVLARVFRQTLTVDSDLAALIDHQ